MSHIDLKTMFDLELIVKKCISQLSTFDISVGKKVWASLGPRV